MKTWKWTTTYLDDDTRIVRADVTGRGEDDRIFYMRSAVSHGASTVDSEQAHSFGQIEDLLKRLNATEAGYAAANKRELAEAAATIAAKDRQIEELLKCVNTMEAGYAPVYASQNTGDVDMGSDDDTSST